MCPPPFITLPYDLLASLETEEPESDEQVDNPLCPQLSGSTTTQLQHGCDVQASSSMAMDNVESANRPLGHSPLDEEVAGEENSVRLRRRPRRGFFEEWARECLPNIAFLLFILQRA
jgi:hypothetical protein